MSTQPGAELYTQGFGSRPEAVEVPVISTTSPTSTNTNYPIGKRWINKLTNTEYVLTSETTSSGATSATWTLLGTNTGALNTLTGNTGGAISPSAGNINVVGSGILSVAGSGSTLTVSSSSAGYPISPYIVGPSGKAGYQTIQSAITAASNAGGGTVYIQPGTYTENLTLANGVSIVGSIDETTVISGIHTPPTSGAISIQNITLQSATHVFNSNSAGSTNITLELCVFNVTNGYLFNLPNWTGTLGVYDSGSIGTNDGFVNNTGGASVNANSSIVGAGTSNAFTISGAALFSDLQINCPGTFQGSAEKDISTTIFLGTLTTAGSCITFIGNSIFQPNGSTSAISHGSSGAIYLDDTAINSSATNAIAGSGAGAVKLGNVSFDQSSGIASTLSVTYNRTVGRISGYIVGPSGNYSTIQSAITAAAASGSNQTVYIQPGTYTESLTLSNGINIEGTSDTGVTITGIHIPPTSGAVEFLNCTLTSATHIFSSASAGSASISCVNCTFNVTNGYVFSLVNWTGSLSVFQSGSIGTNDGFVNNTGGSAVTCAQSNIGAGTGNTMNITGTVIFQETEVSCPINMQTGTSFTVDSSQFLKTITLSNNSTGSFSNSRFSTGATAALTMSSSAAVSVSTCVINSSNNPAIAGAGAGTLTITDVSFLNNAAIAGTLTLAYGTTTTGSFNANGATTVASGTGAINISNDAANTTVRLGTGAGVKTVSVGSTNTTSATTIQAGTGGLSLSAAGAVSMAPVTGSSASTPITITGRVVQATFTGFTTASGASQVFELTDSAITGTTQAILVSADNLGSNDAQMTITRVLQAASSLKVTLKNNGAAALNGDVHITAWILN